MNKKFFFSLIFFCAINLNSQNNLSLPKSPKSPQEPVLYVPVSENSQKEKKDKPQTKNKDKKRKKKLELKVKLFFCNQKTLEGTWYADFETFSFKHTFENIFYHKNLSLTNISNISFVEWKPKLIKERKEGTQYEFVPSSIKITSSDNITFNVKSENLQNFLNFKIENKYGMTTQFSYWMDMQYKDQSWFSKLPIENKQNTKSCFKNVIKQIIFLKQ